MNGLNEKTTLQEACITRMNLHLTIKIKGLFIMVSLNLSSAAGGQSVQSAGGGNSKTRHKTGEDGDWRDCLLQDVSARLSWVR